MREPSMTSATSRTMPPFPSRTMDARTTTGRVWLWTANIAGTINARPSKQRTRRIMLILRRTRGHWSHGTAGKLCAWVRCASSLQHLPAVVGCDAGAGATALHSEVRPQRDRWFDARGPASGKVTRRDHRCGENQRDADKRDEIQCASVQQARD